MAAAVATSAPAGRGAASSGHAPWRGVSLGGWLLLEPGPSRELFARHAPSPGAPVATCEWELMQALRSKGALADLVAHRENFITRADLERIRLLGLNAVRIPFGYWVVLGSTANDPYFGPSLGWLDRAVRWCEELGLQVLLDLHGAPGGESAEAPCGRRQRAPEKWHWRRWRFQESLQALEILAKRYASSEAVTGIAVCNEPSPSVPLRTLCRFYASAVEKIRGAGMCKDTVTIVLPVFQRSLPDFAKCWDVEVRRAARAKGGDAAHGDLCFEVHWYHCFENEWHGRTFAQHLRAVQEHAHELRNYPILVGEWSLALGRGSQPGLLSHDEMRQAFAHAQLVAYREASHGWFFWSWSDSGGGMDWDWQQSHRQGCWPATLELPGGFREPPTTKVPRALCRTGSDLDPLDRLLDVPASDPCIRLGDTIYLRAFNGCYIDVEDQRVRVRYGDRGRWQQFVLCPASCVNNLAAAAAGGHSGRSAALRDGDAVRLLAHTGRFVGVSREDRMAACRWGSEAVAVSCIFFLRLEDPFSKEVRHRSAIFLESGETSTMLAPNEDDPNARDHVVAKWDHLGCWQRLVIEKPLSTAVTPHRPRRRDIASLPKPALRPCPRFSKALKVALRRRLALERKARGRHKASQPRSDAVPLSPRVSAPTTPRLRVRAPSPSVIARRSSCATNRVPEVRTEPCDARGRSAPTPLRRPRRSASPDELEELAALTTLSRRRRISGGSDLLSLLLE